MLTLNILGRTYIFEPFFYILSTILPDFQIFSFFTVAEVL